MHINYTRALSCEGHSSHACKAGSFELGAQLCEPAVHITDSVRRQRAAETGCWCDYQFSNKYQFLTGSCRIHASKQLTIGLKHAY